MPTLEETDGETENMMRFASFSLFALNCSLTCSSLHDAVAGSEGQLFQQTNDDTMMSAPAFPCAPACDWITGLPSMCPTLEKSDCCILEMEHNCQKLPRRLLVHERPGDMGSRERGAKDVCSLAK